MSLLRIIIRIFLFFIFSDGSSSEPSIEIDLGKIYNYMSTLSQVQNIDIDALWREILPQVDSIKSASALINPFDVEYINVGELAQHKIEKSVFKLFQNFSEPCQSQMTKILTSVLSGNVSRNSTYFKMFDYSTKLTNAGKMSASMILVGDYEGCLELEEENFLGQYCSISLKRQWVGYRKLIKEVHAAFGICVPSTCSEEDFRKTLHGKDLKLGTLKVLQGSCQTREPLPMDERATRAFYWALCYIAILTICTLFDWLTQLLSNKKHFPPALVTSFSLYTNIREFLKPREIPEFLKIFNGLRVVLIAVVVLAHDYFVYICRALLRPRDYGKIVYTTGPGLLSSQPVDVFFLISGVLMTMKMLSGLSRGLRFFLRNFFERYIRLFPMAAFLVLVVSPLFPYFSKGPLAYETWDITKYGCEGIEWRFFTFTSSLIDSFICHPHLWHLSTEIQLSFLLPIFIWLTVKFPRFGNGLILITILGLAVFGGIRYYVNKFEVNIMAGDHATFREYSKLWSHLSPYLMGMLVGRTILFETLSEKRIVLSKKQKYLGWAVAISSIGAIYMLAIPVTSSLTGFREYSAKDAAIYHATKTILLPLTFSWLLYANFHGCAGFLGRILSSNFFEPFAKINFCFYIIHMPYQLLKASKLWSPVEIQNMWAINDVICDYVTVTILAFVTHLTIEVPMNKFLSIILNFVWPKTNSPLERTTLDKEKTKKKK